MNIAELRTIESVCSNCRVKYHELCKVYDNIFNLKVNGVKVSLEKNWVLRNLKPSLCKSLKDIMNKTPLYKDRGHETLASAITEAQRFLTKSGYEYAEDFTIDPMNYNSHQRIIVSITKNGKVQRKCQNMSITRFDDGTYELITYIN